MPKRTTPRLNKASLMPSLILSLEYYAEGIGNETSAKAVIKADSGAKRLTAIKIVQKVRLQMHTQRSN